MATNEAGTWRPLGKPVRIRHAADLDGFTIRWARAQNDDGVCRWVDFAIYQVNAIDSDGRHMYPLPDAPSNMDVTADIDAAAPIVDGFVKWDGCTQWSQNDGGHVDGRGAFEAFLGALADARRIAMTEILESVSDPEYD